MTMPNMEKWSEFFGFQTFGDPALEKMLMGAAAFIKDLRAGGKPRWLSLTGSSGAGKTFLARKIWDWYSRQDLFHRRSDPESGIYPGDFYSWPETANSLQKNEGRELVGNMGRDAFLVLDDIGACKDKSGFVTGELSVLLGRRTAKWTVITSNLALADIAQNLDTRIASRMIRDGSVVVDVDVMDYGLRRKAA